MKGDENRGLHKYHKFYYIFGAESRCSVVCTIL